MFKVCFIGADGVGKTSIIFKYTRNTFSTSYLATMGCDFHEITFQYQNQPFQVKIWDIASQKNFQKMRSYYLPHSNFVVICCDIKRFTEEYINPWIVEAKENISPQIKFILTLNKIDLEDNREWLEQMQTHLEQTYHVPVVLTSAKSGENIALLFQTIEKFLVTEYLEKIF